MGEDKRYRSRKFLLCAFAAVSGLGLFIAGKLAPQEWIGFTQWIVGLYLAGNVADEAATRVAK